MPVILDTSIGSWLFPQGVSPRPAVETAGGQPMSSSAMMTVFGLFVAGGMIGLIGYIIFAKYVPSVVNTAEKVIHTTADKTAPILARKPIKTLPPKQRKLITERTVFWLRFSFAVMPAIFFAVVFARRQTLLRELALLVTSCISASSLICFVIQRLLSRLWNLAV